MTGATAGDSSFYRNGAQPVGSTATYNLHISLQHPGSTLPPDPLQTPVPPAFVMAALGSVSLLGYRWCRR